MTFSKPLIPSSLPARHAHVPHLTGYKYLGSLYEKVNKAQLVSHCQLWSCSTLPAAASFCWGTCQHAGLSCCETFCDADSNMQPAAKCPQLATVHPLSLRMLFLSPPLFIPSPLVFALFCLKASVRAHHSALLSALMSWRLLPVNQVSLSEQRRAERRQTQPA